jgi:hypothetical protein
MEAVQTEAAVNRGESLDSLGTTAIARCIPTNPVADAGTFLGELREGLPKIVGRSLFKSAFKDYRKVGGEYLNIEFGWKPLVSDLMKFTNAATNSEKIVRQLHRDSGKNIRRKYAFKDDVSYTKTQQANVYAWVPPGALSTYLYTGPGKLVVDTETRVSTWFSGCFTYHLNLGVTLQDKMDMHAAEARKLYGTELTPETVWNLAPWSWLVDWNSNIGDVIHNVNRFGQDGLVMRYGYIMQRKTVVRTYTLLGGGLNTGAPTRDLKMTVTAESKVRQRATPFGFGFDMGSINGRQAAILGALGISRGPRHL